MESPKKEICIIRIIFPVTSDEEALAIKKKAVEAVSDKPDALTEFNIKAMPDIPNMR